MRGAHRGLVALFVLAVAGAAIFAAAAPSAAATSADQPLLAQNESTNATNVSTEPTNSGDLSLTELKARGVNPEGAPPGVRPASSFSEYRLQHLPTGFWVLEGEDSPFWTDVTPGTYVQRNKLVMWSKRPYQTDEYQVEDKQIVVRVAFWQEETIRYTTENNETRTKTIPTNVTVKTETATIGSGYSRVEVDLPAHFDESYHMTVTAQEAGTPNALENPTVGTRWADMTHHSSRVSQVVEATSLGKKTFWTIFMMIVTAFFAAIFLYISRQVIEGAAAPPRIPWYAWVMTALAHVIGIFVAWDYLANVLVTFPWLAAIYLGMLLGIVAAFWFGEDTYLAAMIRFKLGEVADPGISREIDKSEGETVPDGGSASSEDDGHILNEQDGTVMGVVGMDIVPQRLAKVNGERVVIGDGGLIPFFARFRDKMTKLTFDREATTRFDVDAGPFEEAWLLDPEAEKPLEYEEEGLKRSIPPLRETRTVENEDGQTATVTEWNLAPYLLGGVALAGSFLVGQTFLHSGVLGLLIGGLGVYAFGVLEPTEGTAHAKLAPPHYNSAVGFMLQHSVGLQAAKNWVDQFKQRVSDKTNQVADTKSLEEEAQQSQMGSLYEAYVGENGERPSQEVIDDD